jgi:alpha-glucosidase
MPDDRDLKVRQQGAEPGAGHGAETEHGVEQRASGCGRWRVRWPRRLGQAFNFDLLEADFDAGQFREVITANLELAAASGSSSTWVLSSHDVVRHATRYGLPPRGDADISPATRWLLTGGAAPPTDRAAGLARARAATLLMLALPGSAYLYQGEELGLPEVPEIPADQRQDPTFFRSPGVDVGRDGCRVPLPWHTDPPSFGFGTGGAHLPQPPYFRDYAVAVQDGDPDSTLTLYRRAIALRRRLRSTKTLCWIANTSPHVVHFSRPNGWQSVTNFGASPVPRPDGNVLLTSGPLPGDVLPPATTIWLQ